MNRHAGRASASTVQQADVRPVVAGIAISHPARIIFPDPRISKLDLARYFDEVAEWITPHLHGRPLTLLHCPGGLDAPCAFLKHAKAWGPTVLKRVRIAEKTKVGEYLVADSPSGAVALAQMGIVEIHTWNSVADDVERPNRIVWDLDPGEDVGWTSTVAAARLLRRVLETLGLDAWVKTTGGAGLHVVVPVRPRRDWSECLTFARRVSEIVVRTDPDLYTTAFARRGRENKILFDYLRNNRTNTTISAYSPRARAGAPVSVPIAWAELSGRRLHWTMGSVVRRLRRMRVDPWRAYWSSRQQLTDRAMRAVAHL